MFVSFEVPRDRMVAAGLFTMCRPLMCGLANENSLMVEALPWLSIVSFLLKDSISFGKELVWKIPSLRYSSSVNCNSYVPSIYVFFWFFILGLSSLLAKSSCNRYLEVPTPYRDDDRSIPNLEIDEHASLFHFRLPNISRLRKRLATVDKAKMRFSLGLIWYVSFGIDLYSPLIMETPRFVYI